MLDKSWLVKNDAKNFDFEFAKFILLAIKVYSRIVVDHIQRVK